MKKITVIGSINADYVFEVDHTPVAGENLLSSGFSIFPGGKGANQACALARIGAQTTLLGAVGKDSNGDMELESLAGAGVDIRFIQRADVPTGMTAITVNRDGDNSIVVAQNANLTVNREYIDRNMEVIRQSDVVVLQLEIPFETVRYIAETAKSMGKMVILDPAPAPGRLSGEFLRCIDVIKPNETELESLTGLSAIPENLPKACGMLLDQGVGCVLVTLGAGGAFSARKGTEPQHFLGNKVQAVDTTAAGDSFIAAVAYALSGGMGMDAAIRFANDVAGIVVTRKGAQASIPTAAEIQSLLRQGAKE